MSARSIHRKLAWVAGVVAILWAATGFLHPIMSWTAPRAAVQKPPEAFVALAGVVSPGAAFAPGEITDASMVRLVETDGRRYWQAVTPGGLQIARDAQTGALAPHAVEARAVALARHYAALPQTPVAFARRIESFSTDYPTVNKLLPVWEVRFARPDGLTLYVEPGADRLAMTTNDARRVMLATFQNVHTLKVLAQFEPLRLGVLAVLIVALLAATLFGAAILVAAKGRRVRRVHRLLAWVALPLTLGFAGSGLFHLFTASSLNEVPAPHAKGFQIAHIAAMPLVSGVASADVSIAAAADGAPLWRVQPESGSALYFGADGRVLAMDDAARARSLAGASSQASVTRVSRFSADYGFINKRLPVLKVGDGPAAVFVDTREGLIAARAVRGIQAAEAWTFDVIHKWEPVADLVGRRNRDYLTMLAVAVIAITALLGLVLAARRRKQGEDQ